MKLQHHSGASGTSCQSLVVPNTGSCCSTSKLVPAGQESCNCLLLVGRMFKVEDDWP
jgi:hypothetical protein